MKHFSEENRYIYDLNENSIVVDAGGYEGNWFKGIYERYKCNITVFEPIYKNYLNCCLVAWELTNESQNDRSVKIRLLNTALGATYGRLNFGTSGDSAGLFAAAESTEKVIVSCASVVMWAGLPFTTKIDLLKLNIEGGEYEVINNLFGNGRLSLIKNIQVQCHFNHEGAKEKYAKMKQQLSETHEPEWDSEPVWQNYRLKS